jgi:Domain of unknown function (DUF4918)
MTWAEHLIQYYFQFNPPSSLPGNVESLHPQKQEKVREVVEAFYNKYYNDDGERLIMLGINPGRFGAGVTGVNFTAPRQLMDNCGIGHSFKNQSELSAEFIYEMINALGGPEKFYSKIFIGSVYPLGLTRDGKNINYYDDSELMNFLQPFIIQTLNNLLRNVKYKPVCIAIGGEKNFKFLSRLNNSEKWFDSILSLPHPRFIMQYRRPYKLDFIQQYREVIENALKW